MHPSFCSPAADYEPCLDLSSPFVPLSWRYRNSAIACISGFLESLFFLLGSEDLTFYLA